MLHWRFPGWKAKRRLETQSTENEQAQTRHCAPCRAGWRRVASLAVSAIAAAFYDATGKIARRLPLKSAYVQSVLKA